MLNQIHFGDCRDSLRAMSAAGVKVQMCVTSPPYFGLRDYNCAGQIGLEETPEQFIAELVEVFRCVRDVLADDGTLWVNIGDSYATGTTAARTQGKRGLGAATQEAQDAVPRIGTPEGCKTKDLIGIPWMLAFALRADGWYLRQEIIWHKPNPMPESVTDRCTKAHESLFLLSKGPRYYFDHEAIKEPATCARMRGSGPMVNAGTGRGDAATGTVGDYRARTKSDSFKREGSKREQAIPGQSMGTHRPDRSESEYDIGMRNKRSVWSVATRAYKGAHFAVYPPELIEPCILAGSRPGDVVLDCFMGSGTSAAVAIEHGRKFIGCDLNPDYKPLQDERIAAARAAVAEAQAAIDLAARQGDMFAEVRP